MQERQHLQHCLKHTINNLLQREVFTTAVLNQLCDSIQASRTRFLGNYDANVLAVALQQHGLELQWHDSRDTQLSSINLGPQCSTAPHPQCNQAVQQQDHQRQALTCAVRQQQGYNEGQQQPCTAGQQLLVAGSTSQHSNNAAQSDLFGIILNTKGWGPWAWLIGGRHWLAIKYMQGQWWNLDSRLSAPQSFVKCQQDEADGGATQLREFLKQQLQDGAHILLVRTVPK